MTVGLVREQPVVSVVGPRAPVAPAAGRLDGIDLLRGLVMVLMALDHVRDYFTVFSDPTDFNTTTPGLFLTRWVTHFCAPTFVFLAGTGAFLAGSRGKTRGQLAWFLFSRGLWLMLLEVTLVHLSWNFQFDLQGRGGAVIWAIGASMVCMAALVYLPTSAVAALGVAVIAFHNLFDNVRAGDVNPWWRWVWALLHTGEPIGFRFNDWMLTQELFQPGTSPEAMPTFIFGAAYPLLPWLGTMAAGYGLGALFLLDGPTRRRQLLGLGLALTFVFAVLRGLNVYGDPRPWTEQKDALFTFFSFLNCWKYPPSLLYLLMTLGPAITALAVFDRGVGWLGRPLVIFGRVPLFFYLLHLPLIHGLAVAIDYYRFGWSPLSNAGFFNLNVATLPPDYGFSLPLVYLIWAGVVVALFPLCWAYSRLKRRYPGGILSYL